MMRDIKRSDIPILVQFGYSFTDESIYRDLTEYCPEKVEALFEKLVRDKNGIAIMHEPSKAFFFGYVEEHHFSTMRVAYDVCTYVPKSHRGTGIGYRLMKQYIKEAEMRNAQEIVVGDIGGIDQERLHQMHEKLGFTYRSKVYSKFTGVK